MSSDNPTREEVLASIVPKSDQLNADDLVTGPITVTITKVRRGDSKQPITVEIEGHRPYKPCKTMRRLLIAVFSENPQKWVGQQATLYCDPDVLYGGVRVGGIRISHLSGLSEPKTFIVTKGRGNRKEVTVEPLAAAAAEESPEDQEFIEASRVDLQGAQSLKELRALGEKLTGKPAAVQDALRPVYAKRQTELKGAQDASGDTETE